MNAKEALALCRFVKAACPQQAIDEMTPDAWVVLLAKYRFEDCKQAAIDLAQESPFVAPAEIIARVKQIRGKRIAEYGPFEPPPEVVSGQRDYREWFIETRTLIGNGELVRTGPAVLESGDPHPTVLAAIQRATPKTERREYARPETESEEQG